MAFFCKTHLNVNEKITVYKTTSIDIKKVLHSKGFGRVDSENNYTGETVCVLNSEKNGDVI